MHDMACHIGCLDKTQPEYPSEISGEAFPEDDSIGFSTRHPLKPSSEWVYSIQN